MSQVQKMQNILKDLTIKELKIMAIVNKDAISTEDIIISDQINNRLIKLMPEGEFAKFAEEKLF